MVLAGDGLTAEAIAPAVGKSLLTVRRYMAKAVDGLLKDATRPSRIKSLTPLVSISISSLTTMPLTRPRR